MPQIFESLPGMEVPVGDIARGFTRLWADTDAQEMKAMQCNLVLHFGLNTTSEDATEQFRIASRFAQRYPSRVVVLCPLREETAKLELRAKIYGECFLGKSKGDTRCIEFVALSYPPAARAYLQDQVSVCLSADLPMYYWAHRFTSSQRLAAYHYLLTRAQRVLFDSALVPADAFTYPWPKLAAVRDLAYTRTLPLRQNIGQFLSRYDPALIAGGLRKITLRHRAEFAAEGNGILAWLRKGLARSGAGGERGIDFEVTSADCPGSFKLEFIYAGPPQIFRWEVDLARDLAIFEGDLGTGRSMLTVGAHLLAPEMALGEAMFF